MLESEYYEIKEELRNLPFRVPQNGIKFKYGKFMVQSSNSFDRFGKQVYSVYKSSDTFWEKNLFLYPIENNTDIGFIIRDMDMNYGDVKEFIDTIKNKDSPYTVYKRIYAYEGFLRQLLYDAKYQCTICMEEYKSGGDINILPCSHHFHTSCISEYIKDKPCPICRTKTINE